MKKLVIVRGGGDIATGTIYQLVKCGFPVLVTEIDYPLAVRRNVAFSEAIANGSQTVEDMTCYLANTLSEALQGIADGKLMTIVDEDMDCLNHPEVFAEYGFELIAVVDAILAKKNLGMRKDMAPLTIGMGPGFIAGEDVDAVIETMRGHKLGRVIWKGPSIPNTRTPGNIEGYTMERVIHAPATGMLKNIHKITDTVQEGEVIATVTDENGTVWEAKAKIPGLLRGLMRDGHIVKKGFKIGDVDPRIAQYDNCFTISDKARCIAGGVLLAILSTRGTYWN